MRSVKVLADSPCITKQKTRLFIRLEKMDGKIQNSYFGCVTLIACLLMKDEYIILNNEKCTLALIVFENS